MSEELVLKFVDPKPMRYGENSHQSAVFYRDPTCTEASLATAKQLWGKEQSSSGVRSFLTTTSSTLTPHSKWPANSAKAMPS